MNFWPIHQGTLIGLAAIELVFFVGACMVLYFVFLMKVVVITHQCCSCCRAALAQCQGLFVLEALLVLLGQQGTEIVQVAEGGRKSADLDWQRDIPYHMVSCSAVKPLRKKEECGTSEVTMFVLSGNGYVWWTLLFWEWLNNCLLMGSSEWIPCSAFICFACMNSFLLYLVNCVFFNPWGTSTFLIPSPIPCGELLCDAELPAQVKPQWEQHL